MPPQLCPDADFSQELGAHIDRETWLRERATGTSTMSPVTPVRNPSPSLPGSGIPSNSPADPEGLEPSDDEYCKDNQLLQENLKRISINPMHSRFFGKSSGVRLIQTAMDLKSEYSGKREIEGDNFNISSRRPEFWIVHPVSCVHRASFHMIPLLRKMLFVPFS